MLKRTERQILCFDFILKTQSSLAIIPAMDKVIREITQHFSNQTLSSYSCNNQRTVYKIGDIQCDNTTDVVMILIRKCDLDASDAVYSNIKTNSARIITKTKDEGSDLACHLVISLKPKQNTPNTYLCHMENIRGISRVCITRLFNSILKTINFEYSDPSGARLGNGEFKQKTFHLSVEMMAHKSKILEQDIINGSLTGITLVSDSDLNLPLGGDKYLKQKKHKLAISVESDIPKTGILARLMGCVKSKSKDFQTAVIKFKDSNNIPQKVEFDTDTGSIISDQYIDNYFVNKIKPPMNNSCEKIIPFLVGEMQKELKKRR